METDVKTILADCGFSFKKQFGQNFITDKNLLNSIAEKSGAGKEDCVLEIGCGAGTLTRTLAERVKKVVAYEIDKSLKPVLTSSLKDLKNVEVVFEDFLKADIKKVEEKLEEGYYVVANLPYYVTTPLVMKILEQSEKCKGLCVMVQKEVAERFCAKAGEAEYGAVTAMIALRCRCEIVKQVSRNMFYPRPNVDSAVVKFVFYEGLDVSDKKAYKKVVQAAFSSRRKTLENNLVNGFGFSRREAQDILTACGIDLKARGETLTPEKFAFLADFIVNFEKCNKT